MTSNFKELPSIFLPSIRSSKCCSSSNCSAICSPSCQLSSPSSFTICEQSHLCLGFCPSKGLHQLSHVSSALWCVLHSSPSSLPFSSVLPPGSLTPVCPGSAFGSFCSFHSGFSFSSFDYKGDRFVWSWFEIFYHLHVWFFLLGYCRP